MIFSWPRPTRKRTICPPGYAWRQRREQGAVAPHESNGTDAFRAFVAALHANRTVRSLALFEHDFGRPIDGTVVAASEVDDVRRLFALVLPGHRSLMYVRVSNCRRLPPSSFMAFMGALTVHTGIRHVEMRSCPLTAADVRAAAAMLRRNVPVSCLLLQNWVVGVAQRRDIVETGVGGLVADHDHDDRDACRILCDACAHNEHIDSLVLHDGSMVIDRGAMAGALGPTAPKTLARLELHGAWTSAGIADALFHLRTNETLERFIAKHRVADADAGGPVPAVDVPYEWVEELLLKYNCTLRSLDVLSTTHPHLLLVRTRHLLHGNLYAREARRHLENRNYAIEPLAVWPRALERVARFATLVYRFVRRGNVAALSDHLRRSSRTGTKRVRESDG
jgi:hypothetical protein